MSIASHFLRCSNRRADHAESPEYFLDKEFSDKERNIQAQIKESIKKWYPNEQESPRKIIFLFANEDDEDPQKDDLFDWNIYIQLVSPKRKIRPISTPETQNISEFTPAPIILLSQENVADKKRKFDNKYSDNPGNKPPLPPLFFWDSSIWHKNVPIQGEYLENFQLVLKEIVQNYEKGLYDTLVAKESLEFQCRMMANNYLLNVEGGHGKGVEPIYFHSEAEKKGKEDVSIRGLKWGCLLIDDFAFTGLRTGEKAGHIRHTKIDLIEDLVGDKIEILNREEYPDNFRGKFAKRDVEEIKDLPIAQKYNAEKFIDWKKYAVQMLIKYPNADIILLDFYLGPYFPQGGKQIVEEIASASELALTCPFGKHWVFPISTFGYAFKNSLQDLANINRRIHLADGADPLLTPELFKHNLLNLMQEQKEMLDLDPVHLLHPFGDIQKNNLGLSLDKNLLRREYPIISTKISHYYALEKARSDEGKVKASLFAKSYCETNKKEEQLFRFYAHLQQLVYRITFEPEHNWPKMWEECQELKRLLWYDLFDMIPKAEELINGPIKNIENYLQALKIKLP